MNNKQITEEKTKTAVSQFLTTKILIRVCLFISFSIFTVLVGLSLAGKIDLFPNKNKQAFLFKTKEKENDYVPDEIIMKYKPKLGSQAKKLFNQGKKYISVTKTPYLDSLNNKYGVKDIRRVFKSLEKRGSLKGEEIISSKEVAQETAKKFSSRAIRAPKKQKELRFEDIYILTLKSGVNITEAVKRYEKDPNVIFAQPNYILNLYEVPNDEYYFVQWPLINMGQGYPGAETLPGYHNDRQILKYGNLDSDIDPENIWDTNKGEDITVAVIDTGIDYNHEDIINNIWINEGETGVGKESNGIDDDGNGYIDDFRGYDISDNDNNPSDYYGHGTHCAGIISAEDNDIGIRGVSPRAKIMNIKGFPNATSEVLSEAIYYATNNGADVLSNSWGPSWRRQSDPTLEQAVGYAYDQGSVVVFAAGNNNDDVAYYSPANMNETMAVVASDSNDQRASFSNWGDLIDVAAPGYEVLSLRAAGRYMGPNYEPKVNLYPYPEDPNNPDNRYLIASGTSMAAPHVAGLAALILSNQSGLNYEQVRQAIRSGAEDIFPEGKDVYFGYGRINAYLSITGEDHPSPLYTNFNNPNSGEYLRDNVDITGTAKGDTFNNFTLYYSQGYYPEPDDWIEIYSSANPIDDSSLYLWDLSSLSNGEYALRIVVTSTDNRTSTYKINFKIDRSLKNGWPVSISYTVLSYSGFTIDDIDNNGSLEIAIGRDAYPGGWAHILNYNGQKMNDAWPITTLRQVARPMAFANVDSDPEKEISASNFGGRVYLWDIDGNNLPGWPRYIGGNSLGAATIADIENDGDMEIMTTWWNPSEGAFLSVWHHDGTKLPEFNDFDPGLAVAGKLVEAGVDIYTSPAVADIDGNGDLEIFVLTSPGSSLKAPRIFAYHHNGTEVSGWNGGKIAGENGMTNYASPIIGDIDNNGDLEIIVASGGEVFAFNHDGTDFGGSWPFFANEMIWHPPAMADIDHDGDLEIFVSTGLGRIYGIDHTGSQIPGLYFTPGYPDDWPETPAHPTSSVAIGDIDGDNMPEIFTGCANDFVYAYHLYDRNNDGYPDLMDGWPKHVNSRADIIPALGDLDNDGHIEVLFSTDSGKLFAWGFSGGNPKNIDWPMYQYDSQNTGDYSSHNFPPILDPIGDQSVTMGNTLTLQISARDPEDEPLNYSVSKLPSGATFNSNTREFNWPNASPLGTYKITFTVTDDLGATDSETINIFVRRALKKPINIIME